MVVIGSIATGVGLAGLVATAAAGETGVATTFGAVSVAGLGLDVGGILLIRARRKERERINQKIYELKHQRSNLRHELKAQRYR
jgi:hypothetical protein